MADIVNLGDKTLTSGGYVTLINQDTNFLIGQGRFPFVQVDGINSLSEFKCTIYGTTVQPLP